MESYELTRSTAEPFLSPLLLHFPMTLGKKQNPHFIGLFFSKSHFMEHSFNTVRCVFNDVHMGLWVQELNT